MANDSNNETRQSLFVYRLTLGDSIKSSDGKSSKLTIEQEIKKSCNADGGTYTITLHEVNVKKKIYQPCEIIAEMDLEKEQKEASGTVKTVAPSFKDAQDLFLKRLVKLELVVANTMEDVDGTDNHSTVYTIAENYYVQKNKEVNADNKYGIDVILMNHNMPNIQNVIDLLGGD